METCVHLQPPASVTVSRVLVLGCCCCCCCFYLYFSIARSCCTAWRQSAGSETYSQTETALRRRDVRSSSTVRARFLDQMHCLCLSGIDILITGLTSDFQQGADGPVYQGDAVGGTPPLSRPPSSSSSSSSSSSLILPVSSSSVGSIHAVVNTVLWTG